MRTKPRTILMWQNLYLYSDSAPAPAEIAETLRAVLIEDGYESYDPFAAMPGKSYPLQRRLFIAPSVQGWTRILGDTDESLMPALSTHGLCLRCAFDGTAAQIVVYDGGIPVDARAALTAHLAGDCSENNLALILSGELEPAHADNNRLSDTSMPLEALPEDVQAMAENLNPKHINRMFDKWMKRVNKRLGSDASGARDLLRGQSMDWSTAGGRQIQALMDCLGMPSGSWRSPDFTTLRDAYQIHLRRQQRPNASLFPGDAEAMQAVPDALDYTPLYMGKAD
jgi:hypothetical protein